MKECSLLNDAVMETHDLPTNNTEEVSQEPKIWLMRYLCAALVDIHGLSL